MKGFKSKDVYFVCVVYGLGLIFFFFHGDAIRYRPATPPLSADEIGHIAKETRGDTVSDCNYSWHQQDAAQQKRVGDVCLDSKTEIVLEQPVWRDRLVRRYPRSSRVDAIRNNFAISAARIFGRGPLVSDPGASFPEPYSLRGTLGYAYLSTGDYDSARNFLRAAVRTQTDPVVRNYLCGELAWLEDDLQIAARLLEQSLSQGPGPGNDSRWIFVNAVELALATETEWLAQELLEKFPDCWAAIPQESRNRSHRENRWIWHQTRQAANTAAAMESTD